MCVCVCVGGGGITSCNLPVVIPGYLATVMLIARRGTDGLASRPVPCASSSAQKPQASKTKKSSVSRNCDTLPLFHAKSRTRIACWNVRTLGSLSEQSAQLRAAMDTTVEKRNDLLSFVVSILRPK